MGATSITSNVKSDKKLVIVKTPEGEIETGLKKFGAMLGDEVEVGCGSVLNPGTVVGKPYEHLSAFFCERICTGEKAFIKKQGEVVEKTIVRENKMKKDRVYRSRDHGKIHGAEFEKGRF